MVNRVALFVLLLTNPVSAQAILKNTLEQDACQADSFEGAGKNYSIPRPYRLSKIKSLVINQNGAWSDNVESSETTGMCSSFLLSKNDVRDFFRHPKRISGWEYWNGLSMSRCHAYGEITFVNGDYGKWRIDAMRRGRIILADGRSLYFLGKNARAKALYEYSPEHDTSPTIAYLPYRAMAIKSVIFKPAGTTWRETEDQAAGLCAGFLLNTNDVKDYFLHARQLKWIGDAPGSSCSVEGEVEFVNGDHGKWSIERSRRGVLWLDDGRRYDLYSKEASAEAFDEP